MLAVGAGLGELAHRLVPQCPSIEVVVLMDGAAGPAASVGGRKTFA